MFPFDLFCANWNADELLYLNFKWYLYVLSVAPEPPCPWVAIAERTIGCRRSIWSQGDESLLNAHQPPAKLNRPLEAGSMEIAVELVSCESEMTPFSIPSVYRDLLPAEMINKFGKWRVFAQMSHPNIRQLLFLGHNLFAVDCYPKLCCSLKSTIFACSLVWVNGFIK